MLHESNDELDLDTFAPTGWQGARVDAGTHSNPLRNKGEVEMRRTPALVENNFRVCLRFAPRNIQDYSPLNPLALQIVEVSTSALFVSSHRADLLACRRHDAIKKCAPDLTGLAMHDVVINFSPAAGRQLLFLPLSLVTVSLSQRIRRITGTGSSKNAQI